MLNMKLFWEKSLINKISVIIAVTFATVIIIWFYRILSSEKIFSGISIEGEDVSGKTLEQAEMLINKRIASYYGDNNLYLGLGESTFKVELKEFEFRYDVTKALRDSYALGRSGNIFFRIYTVQKLKFKNTKFHIVPVYNKSKLQELLTSMKRQVDQEASSAFAKYKNGSLSFEKEVTGRKIDIDKSLSLIESEIKAHKFDNIRLIVEEITPEILLEEIKDISSILSSTTTHFNTSDTNRSFNIKLACEKINGTVLKPGDTFSMDLSVGPRTTENGFRTAKIIFYNELIDGTGGGVCQVTSTLYGSVLKSSLQVVERVNHSLPLAYVEPGLDATIAEDYIDFKFSNSRDYPVCITAEVIGGSITTRIYGKKYADENIVKLKSQIVEEIAPQGEDIIIDDSLGVNERKVVRQPKMGYRAVVYREIYNKSGQLIQKEKISDSYYRPTKMQVKVSQSYYEYNFIRR